METPSLTTEGISLLWVYSSDPRLQQTFMQTFLITLSNAQASSFNKTFSISTMDALKQVEAYSNLNASLQIQLLTTLIIYRLMMYLVLITQQTITCDQTQYQLLDQRYHQ